MRGLFVDYWHPGLHSQAECDRLLSMCSQSGVTDLLVHCPKRDALTAGFLDAGFDHLAYLIQNKGTIRIHAFVSLLLLTRQSNLSTLVSKGNLPTGADNSWLMRDSAFKKDAWVYLDPTVAAVRSYLANDYVGNIARNYAVTSIVIDRLRYPFFCDGKGTDTQKKLALTTLLQSIKTASGTIPLALTVRCESAYFGVSGSDPVSDLANWPSWYQSGLVSDIIPILFQKDSARFETFLNAANAKGARRVILGASRENLQECVRRYKLIDALGITPIVWSYASLFGDSTKKITDFSTAVDSGT